MTTTAAEYKSEVRKAVDRRKNEFLEILSKAVQYNTDNPPGDTRSLADYLHVFLRDQGIHSMIYDPVKENPNVVAYLGDASSRPHLILNGHLDQFPADDPALWSDDPYSGRII
jgi:succinyl-diaminopimelate desuccinylase